MGVYSFRLTDDDKRAIQGQMEIAGRLIQQRDQIIAQIAHEVGYVNAIWKAACLSAQLAGHLPKGYELNLLIMPNGSMTAKIDQDGLATWQAKDIESPEVATKD